MPRIESIARSSPTRSSSVRCSVADADASGPVRAVSVLPKVTLRRVQHPERVERLWTARMRWRMRGAWLWPAFFGLTAVDGILIVLLPPYDGAPQQLLGGVLLAGFANLLAIAVAAPLAGRLLRRRRPDLPRMIANDY